MEHIPVRVSLNFFRNVGLFLSYRIIFHEFYDNCAYGLSRKRNN